MFLAADVYADADDNDYNADIYNDDDAVQYDSKHLNDEHLTPSTYGIVNI